MIVLHIALVTFAAAFLIKAAPYASRWVRDTFRDARIEQRAAADPAFAKSWNAHPAVRAQGREL